VLYLNYAALEKWKKTHHVILISSLIIFLLCRITHGLKNQGLLDKKLNNKRKKKKKKKSNYLQGE